MAGRRVYKPKIIIITRATHSYTHTFVRATYVYIRWRPIGVYIHTYRINEATRRRMFNEQRHEFAIGTEIDGRGDYTSNWYTFKPIFQFLLFVQCNGRMKRKLVDREEVKRTITGQVKQWNNGVRSKECSLAQRPVINKSLASLRVCAWKWPSLTAF